MLFLSWIASLCNRNKGSLRDKTRRDEYDVDEDAGGNDSHEYDTARRSTSFVTWLAQLSERQKHWEVVQYDPMSMMSMDTGGVDGIKRAGASRSGATRQ